jgi:hypothetical protein
MAQGRTERQPGWKPGDPRERVIMLDTTGCFSKRQLFDRMKQAETDFAFGIGIQNVPDFQTEE